MELNISDTLSTFRFSADPNSMPDFSTLVSLRDSFDDDPRLAHGFEGTPAPTGDVQDFFGDEDFDMGGPVGFDDVMSAAGDEEGVVGDHYGGGGVGMVAPGDRHAPFDPRRVGQQLVIAVVAGDDEEGMFDYFDRGLGKAWAGAEHWKLRKVSRKGKSDYFVNGIPLTELRYRSSRDESSQDRQNTVPDRLPQSLSRTILENPLRLCTPLIPLPPIFIKRPSEIFEEE